MKSPLTSLFSVLCWVAWAVFLCLVVRDLSCNWGTRTTPKWVRTIKLYSIQRWLGVLNRSTYEKPGQDINFPVRQLNVLQTQVTADSSNKDQFSLHTWITSADRKPKKHCKLACKRYTIIPSSHSLRETQIARDRASYQYGTTRWYEIMLNTQGSYGPLITRQLSNYHRNCNAERQIWSCRWRDGYMKRGSGEWASTGEEGAKWGHNAGNWVPEQVQQPRSYKIIWIPSQPENSKDQGAVQKSENKWIWWWQ